MPLLFDLQRFTSEIVTVAVTAVVLKAPAAWRSIRGRFASKPELPELRTTVTRATIQATSREHGEAMLWVEFVNFAKRRFEVEQFQVQSFQFDGAQFPQADAQIAPLRLEVPKGSAETLSVRLRLHRADLDVATNVAVRAPNVRSTPGHHGRIAIVFVVRRGFVRRSVGPRYLEIPHIEAAFAIDP